MNQSNFIDYFSENELIQQWKILFSLINQSKLTDLTVENILSTGVSVKMQITDSISENLTNLDLESKIFSQSANIHTIFYFCHLLLTNKGIEFLKFYLINSFKKKHIYQNKGHLWRLKSDLKDASGSRKSSKFQSRSNVWHLTFEITFIISKGSFGKHPPIRFYSHLSCFPQWKIDHTQVEVKQSYNAGSIMAPRAFHRTYQPLGRMRCPMPSLPTIDLLTIAVTKSKWRHFVGKFWKWRLYLSSLCAFRQSYCHPYDLSDFEHLVHNANDEGTIKDHRGFLTIRKKRLWLSNFYNFRRDDDYHFTRDHHLGCQLLVKAKSGEELFS